MEPVKRTIDGVEYSFEYWSVADHHRWTFIFLALIGRASMLSDAPLRASVLMAATFDDAMWSQLWALAVKYTKRITEGGARILPLEEIEKREVVPATTMAQLMRFHVEQQFDDFFPRAHDLLGVAKGSSSSKSPPV